MEGGTLLRNVILSLGSPTDKAGKLMKKLGLEVYDASGKMRGTNEIFKDLDKILGTMTEQEKTKVLSELFNKVDLKGVNALLANSSERFDELSTAITNSDNAAADMATTMDDNLKGKITGLFSKLEGLGIAFFEKFAEPSKNAVTFASDAIGKVITALGEGNLDGTLNLIGLGLSAVLGYMVAIKVLSIVTMVLSFAKSLITAVKMVKSLSGAMAILNTVFMMNPIGLIIGAIGALVGAFIYLWNTSEGFRNFWISLWEVVKEKCIIAWEAIKGFFTETIPNVIQNIKDWFNNLPQYFSELWEKVKAYCMEKWEGIKNFFTETIPQIIADIVNWFSELPYKIGFALGEVLGKIVKWGVDTWNYFTTNIPVWIEAISSWFKELPGKIWNWLVEAFNKVTTWGSQMYNKAVEVGTNFVNNLINWISQLPNKVWSWLSNTLSKAGQFAVELGRKGIEAGKNLFNGIVDIAKSIPSRMAEIGKNIVQGVWNGIINAKDWLMGKVKGFFSGIVDGAKSALGIHSPSRVFRDEVGIFMAQGVGVGFENEMDNVNKDIEAQLLKNTDLEFGGTFNTNNTYEPQKNNTEELLSRMLITLQELVKKDTVIRGEDGRELMRFLAPYQQELDNYNRMTSLAFR